MAMTSQADGDQGGAKIIERLTAALRSDGDFPVRAKVVSELRAYANNPRTNVEQISELILREPSLGTRVLHLVNSAFYQRVQPVTTVTQAVLQLGMKALSELCAGLVLMQKFLPAAKRGGIFADSVKKTIVTALLSNRLALSSSNDKIAEQGYLAGTFFNLSQLLLAFYFPQVYETAGKRALARGYDVSRSIAEILGASPAELTLVIVDALKIPGAYRHVLDLAHRAPAERKGTPEEVFLANTIAAAGALAEAITYGQDRAALDEVVSNLLKEGSFTQPVLVSSLTSLWEIFRQHCQLIELGFLELPQYLDGYTYGESEGCVEGVTEESESEKSFRSYVNEIKFSIENNDPISSVIGLALECLVYGLGYDRAVLLYIDSTGAALIGRMALGESIPCDVREIRRRLNGPESDGVDVKAFINGTPQIFGDGMFEDGWPYAGIPVGTGDRKKGVIYADVVTSENSKPLDQTAQAALSLLAELLDRSVAFWE